MSEALQVLFAQQLNVLRDSILNSELAPSSEKGFAARVLAEHHFSSLSISESQVEVTLFNQSPYLAIGGYAAQIESVSENFSHEWLQGFSKLKNREPFPLDRASFFFRPADLYGICLGAKKLLQPSVDLDWLKQVLKDGEIHIPVSDIWTHTISRCAANELGVTWNTACINLAESMSLVDLSTLYWILYNNPDVAVALGYVDKKSQLDELLLKRFLTSQIENLSESQSAIVYFAATNVVQQYIESAISRDWLIGRSRRDSLTLLRNLFTKFPLFARQLCVRHADRQTVQIIDEYDVQDLTAALLKLFFDDVRPEEVTPSYAGNSSRTDFFLKNEKIMIELKMTRKSLGQKEIANQLIIDKERYKAHPECKYLVCFVYDPEHHIQNPHAIETDIAQTGDLSVSVIVSPKGT